ncbi:MAG TPA: hypothetical protein VMZ91_09775 [Candidatus Paceibacterota bacterium]|nr:hypothetical protein [Candidatus Paceibacterota bacterium]
MYCPHLKGYCYCYSSMSCSECFLFKNAPISLSQQYNYKCSCGGEFIQPISKTIYKYTEGNGTLSSSYRPENINVCPFCNKEMKGLRG